MLDSQLLKFTGKGPLQTEVGLDELPTGSCSDILAIEGDGRVARELLTLGLVPGARVSVLRRGIGGDPLEISAGGHPRVFAALPVAFGTRAGRHGQQLTPPVARRPLIAVLGCPNTGKSTVFNRLTGLRQRTGNYPGVTVEKITGLARLEKRDIELVDLPGTYSLAADGPESGITLDAVLGMAEGLQRPDALLLIADATNLRRSLLPVFPGARARPAAGGGAEHAGRSGKAAYPH